MSGNLEQAVIEATLRVFETSTFMNAFSQDALADMPETAPDIAATMNFEGPVEGRITLSVAQSLLADLANNMLGAPEEGESLDDKGRDALKEILNMICGNFLTIWKGENPVFELSPPEIVTPDETTGVLPEFPGTRVSLKIEDTQAEIVVEERRG